MVIEFENSATKMLCNSRDLLRNSYGEPAATNVQRMLWMLDAAKNLGSVTSAPPLSLSNYPDDFSEMFSVGGKSRNWPRVVFRPLSLDGSLQEVEGIRVIEIQGVII